MPRSEADTAEPNDIARLKALRSALIAGERSGFVEGDLFRQMHEFLRGLSKSDQA